MGACPDPSILEAFGRGGLGPADRERVELHLDRCSSCAAVLAQLAALWGSGAAARATHEGLAASMARDVATGGGGPTSGSDLGSVGELLVGRYRLTRILGSGAMGIVYEALDPELHRKVAIKLLHPQQSGDIELTRTRMLREARAMAQLAHPNVVAVHDVGRFGEQVFVAMELVEGTTLSRWLAAAPRARAEIVAMFVQAGRGLEAAHAVGLVHRDFKPDNVLIGADGRARVTDFGLARPEMAWPMPTDAAASPESSAESGAPRLGATAELRTEGGAIIGTPAFMAPEQWRGQVADARSDQFSFCVALYQACFGARPFAGDGIYGLCEAVLAGRLTAPPRSAPRWLRAALVRGLAGDPGARHPSMAALLGELEHDRTKFRRAAAVVGAMGVSVAATVAVFAWTADATSAPPSVDLQLPAAEPALAPPPVAPTPAPSPPPVDESRRACVGKLEHARGRWNAARRGKLEEAIATMDDGDAIARRTLPVLDRWASAWTTSAVEACLAAKPVGTPVATPATVCLDHALARFDAVVQQSLDLPKFQVDDSIAAAAYALPDLEPCVGSSWAAAPVAAIAPDRAAAAELVFEELAAGEALTRLDRLTGAPESVSAVVARATELGQAPLVAEAQLALGDAFAAKYEVDDAIAAYEAAAAAAHGGVHEPALLRAATSLVEQHAMRLDVGGVERWRKLARATASRIGDPRSSARLELADARALLAAQELTAALGLLDRSQAAIVAAFGEQHPEVARMWLLRSEVLLGLAKADDARSAARKAVGLYEQTLGPGDLRTGAAIAQLARSSLAAGDLASARTEAARAVKVPVLSESLRHDFDHGTYLGIVGDVALAAGDSAAALEAYETAKIYLYVDAPKLWPLVWHADALVRAGRAGEALAELDAARAVLGEHVAADDPRRIDPLCAIARVERAAGKLDRAARDVATAVTLAEASLGFSPRTGLAQWELAAIERELGHDDRALELLDDAHVPLYSALGAEHPRVVDSLLARADLAWSMGQTEYAGRLYGTIVDDLSARFGPKDARAARARARAATEPKTPAG